MPRQKGLLLLTALDCQRAVQHFLQHITLSWVADLRTRSISDGTRATVMTTTSAIATTMASRRGVVPPGDRMPLAAAAIAHPAAWIV